MTTSCRDSDHIPKVKNAGKIITVDGNEYQIMHNGLLVEHGGYFGDWMSETITTLKGHHEPQEEKVFYELLKLLPAKATMIELGSYWAYYSMWFNKEIKRSTNYCCEPDPKNLALGQRNVKINKLENITFINAAAGKEDGKIISFKPQEGDFEPVDVAIRSVDGIVAEYKIPRLDIIHMDIQGVELDTIEGAEQSIKQGKVRFLIVSTHHYLISNDVLTHEKCIEKIKELGGHIIVEHAIHESFSGDGLVVASFFEEDKGFHLDVSENRMQDSLFRSYNKDMSILIAAYEELREKANGSS
ncbi:MAG: FkbM family methyltransferase [Patescibacteria group bacterium]